MAILGWNSFSHGGDDEDDDKEVLIEDEDDSDDGDEDDDEDDREDEEDDGNAALRAYPLLTGIMRENDYEWCCWTTLGCDVSPVDVLMMVTISSEIDSNESESERVEFTIRLQPIQSNPIQSCHRHHRMSDSDSMWMYFTLSSSSYWWIDWLIYLNVCDL